MGPASGGGVPGLRAEIDAIDDLLLDLLNRRAAVAMELGRLKRELAPESSGLRLWDREAAVLGRLERANKGPLPSNAIAPIFGEIFAACLRVQAEGVTSGPRRPVWPRPAGGQLSRYCLCAPLAISWSVPGISRALDGATMSKEQKGKCDDPECGDNCDCDDEMEEEIEVVELEDENGDMEEFAILDELDFEGRHFVIMAPLAEVQALNGADGGDSGDEADEFDLSVEIFESDGENYDVVEDEALAKRLMEHLDRLSEEDQDGDGE